MCYYILDDLQHDRNVNVNTNTSVSLSFSLFYDDYVVVDSAVARLLEIEAKLDRMEVF